MAPEQDTRQASGAADPKHGAGRNIVICLDGTSNEPESGTTNVARLYAVAAKSDSQVVYYDPGVGTMGARGAVTPLAKRATVFAGLVIGYGVRDNLEEAYTFLMQQHRQGDRIFVFGFSRGAYTARALTGMLRTVGLLRPGAENLVPYAVKLYTKGGKHQDNRESHAPPVPLTEAERKEEQAYWKVRRDFAARFGNPDFPHSFDTRQHQVHFLGVWDTVKSIGWLNWRARWQEAQWPFTRKIVNVGTARHALAIDERRRPFPAYRFHPEIESVDQQEMWFAGVHSDVGGHFPDDHRLSDIALSWMVEEARAAELEVDDAALKRELNGPRGAPRPDPDTLPRIHDNPWPWLLAGGWRHREILPGDTVHPSVQDRIKASSTGSRPYRPRLRDPR